MHRLAPRLNSLPRLRARLTAMAAPPRGAFIVLEGPDRSGKSTQVARLVASLTAAGVPAAAWRYPDRSSAVGAMIDAYLKAQAELDDGAVHLLFAANRWEKRAAMEAALAGGTTLVVDRYAYSGVAFTAAKGLPGLDREWCKARRPRLPANPPDAQPGCRQRPARP